MSRYKITRSFRVVAYQILCKTFPSKRAITKKKNNPIGLYFIYVVRERAAAHTGFKKNI